MGDLVHIADDFLHGANFKHGHYCIIEPDVIVGDDVRIGDYVKLKSGTRIKTNVDLADYVKTTGICIIGNSVNVRTGACISKGVIINDKAFIGPGVMTNHTKVVRWQRFDFSEYQYITNIGTASIIGSNASLVAGIQIVQNAVVAAATNVYKDITEIGVWGGYPLKMLKEVLPSEIVSLEDYQPYTFDPVLLAKYLPKFRGNHAK